MVDLEAKEGVEDIDTVGVEPISKLPNYIPPCKGKVKVPEEPGVGKFLLNMPLLLEGINFEGPCLARIPHLKLEDWDLADHERFPHLAIETYMERIYYKESSVTTLEHVEWIHEVNQSGLLNLLWVPHYHRSNINLIFIR